MPGSIVRWMDVRTGVGTGSQRPIHRLDEPWPSYPSTGLLPSRACVRFTRRFQYSMLTWVLSRFMFMTGFTAQFALLPCLVEFAIPLNKDFPVPAFELVLGGDVAYGAVQT